MNEEDLEEKDCDCESGCACHHHEKHEHSEHHHHHCACCADDDTDDDDDEEEFSAKKIILSIILFICALLIQHLTVFKTFGIPDIYIRCAYLALYFGAYILSGLNVVREAVENLVKGRVFGEEFLMALATIGAIALGEYSEAVAVMILFQIGEFLEDKAVDSSRRSITNLMDVRPDKANVKKDGKIVEMLAEEVSVGDIIEVKPGERVALDGKIVAGNSMIDTSALTGESVPRQVFAGDEILAGCVNTSGLLEIMVSKPFGESTVSRVLELVEHASSKKAKSEKFITKFARIYTPIVVCIAVLIAVIPSLLFKQDCQIWIYRALELLVVSCPCALVISVPLSFFAGIGRASRNGILIKGSNYIEYLSKVDTAVFDKTGTLTKGVFEVTSINPVGDIEKDELLALATHAEYFSNHPVSRSLKNAHKCPMCDKVLVSDTQEISGHGVCCNIDGKKILVGNVKLMQKENITGVKSDIITNGASFVHVAIDGKYAGFITISDIAKDDAKFAIEELKKCGVRKSVLLTGDTKDCADAVGKELGIDVVFSELLPQDKVSKVETLLTEKQGKDSSLVFIGDGINDAPVLTRSDVGIAMGGIGSDAAIEAADVVIMDDMPSKVASVIRIAKKTMRTVWFNVGFSLCVKSLIMVLCALGYANMWLAVFGDVGVTMIAILNAMRLTSKK